MSSNMSLDTETQLQAAASPLGKQWGSDSN